MVQEHSSSLFQEIHDSESHNNEIQPPQLRKDARLRAHKVYDRPIWKILSQERISVHLVSIP